MALVDTSQDRSIVTSDTIVKVVQLNGVPCNLAALIDTGSPVSFICPSVFNQYFSFSCVTPSDSNQVYKALNNTPISTYGFVSTNIVLESLPDLIASVKFSVLKQSFNVANLVIGRDFLKSNKISVTINPSVEEFDTRIELFSEIAFADTADISVISSNFQLEEIQTDFDSSVTQNVISVIREVENTIVRPIDDDYMVKVTLKDDTVYAYSPRRFAWSERQQIRCITDDLLNRGIIKYSTSPYCARVVPIRKRNGLLRLCVDLRPLNSRVVKQKYPFPLIEDCLSRLSNKSVFTLLDLKDGFHHIRIHPEYTKYFSFATPDGQFEYTRLPFGYCEAPAEFQKRLVQVL